MRIQIDKTTYVGARPDGRTTGWIVSPGSGEARDDFASYRLEIEHDYSGEPDRITRVAFRDGERFEFLPDVEFEANAELVAEYENLSDEEAATLLHDQHNRWAYSEGSVLGFEPATTFTALEAAWTAANQFIDFAIAGR
jgi:hypothetical protein